MEKVYKIGQFAKLLNVSVKTLQRWDAAGILPAFRTPSNIRYYTHQQYLAYLGVPSQKENKRQVVIYARVSNRGQKADLANQVEFLRQFANARGMIVDAVFEDIGSGLNYSRDKWNALLTMCQNGEISHVLVAHKDRFIRFGFSWFETFLQSHGVEIVVVNNEKLSPEQELVQDLISIIHVFSCRIYGLRKYKKALREDERLC